MSNSTFQSLLMESGDGLPTPEPACEYDPYYNTGPTNDPYWASVNALLHFDGNLTDSSSVGATYTDNSTSFNSTTARFGQSLRTTNNTTQGLESPLSSNYDINSDDYTIELWVRPEATPSADRVLLGFYDSSGTAEYTLVLTSGLVFKFNYPTGAGTQSSINGFTGVLNYWFHVAVSRIGDTYKIFCDGRKIALATNSYRRSTGSKYLRIANSAPGVGSTAIGASIDEVRVTKGVARYLQNFAYDLTPFPNELETEWSPSDPRTVLSLTAEPRIKDQIFSVPGVINANDTITYNGEIITASINDATAVSYSTDGITITTDNSNNYITYTGDKVIPLNYYDIIEYKVTATYTGTLSGSGNPVKILSVGISGIYTAIAYYVQSGVMRLFIYYRIPTTTDFSYVDTAIPVTGEYAIRYNRRTQTISWLVDNLTIAQSGTPGTYSGPNIWPITAFRLGPNAQASRGGITSITLKDCQINTYFQEDAAGYQPQRFYANRNSSVSDAEVKFGNLSYYSWNTGSSSATRLFALAITNELQFEDLDFTLDLWAYRLANTYTGRIWSYSLGVSGFVEIDTSGDLSVSWLSSGGAQARSALANISTGEWVHYAFQRRGTLLETYVNGVRVDSIAISGGASSTITPTIFAIGSPIYSFADNTHFNGYLDGIRLLKGAARYSGDFTPPGLPTCDASDPGVVIPTSGTEYPSGEAATVHTGQITLANHYQPLSGQSVQVTQADINENSPFIGSRNVTFIRTLPSSDTQTISWGIEFNFLADGRAELKDTVTNSTTYLNYLTTIADGAASNIEIALGQISFPTGTSVTGDWQEAGYNPATSGLYGDITVPIVIDSTQTTVTNTVNSFFVVRQIGDTSVTTSNQIYNINLVLNKPAISVPVYPDFDSGTKVNSESGNVFTWYFNPNGTITSGAINGAQVGRWIDAFDDVTKASDYRLVVYSDPLPGGFQRVSPTTLIGSNMGTSARVRHVNFGSVGSELYVGFTLRIYPLPTNPRYNEANYFGQYTFTMVIPQISGL